MADLLERRWQLSIIYAALTGALRFNEFADAVAGISPRMLAERLRDLEAAELIERLGLEIAEKRMLTQHRQFAAHHAARIPRPVQAGDGVSYRPVRSHSPIAFLARKHAPAGGGGR